jgi:UDP-glucose:(heptosyl)LPS alpha-1,3-glucosyltransferase
VRIGLARRGFSSTGGAENYLRRLASALEEAGHECVLFASPQWPRDRWPGGGLIPVAGQSPRTFADRLAALQPHRHCDLLFSLERVWNCDCYRAGDGVHRAWLERRARAEPVWKPWLRQWNPKHRQLLALEEKMFAGSGAGRVIANSRLVREEIIQSYGYPAERVAVVYNGLPAPFFKPAGPDLRSRARAAFGLANGDFAILFAGTGWERKGLRYLLAAVAELPEAAHAVLLVAGRGAAGPFLRGLPVQARVRTRFLGPVSDMPACYAAADVFALPTLYDPFSNACLEALAAGLPVVTSRANGFSEIIENEREGHVLDVPEDIDALAAALLAWVDPVRRQDAGQCCAAKAAAFTMEANVRQTLEALSLATRRDES